MIAGLTRYKRSDDREGLVVENRMDIPRESKLVQLMYVQNV